MVVKAYVDIQREIELARYIDELPTCDRYEDRLFFLNGIKTLKDKLNQPVDDDPKRLIQSKKKQGYTVKQICKKCCVPRGELSNPAYNDQIIIACTYGF